MSNVALIPARGGSKGVPRKNLRPLLGRPLVEHAVRFARLCPEVERTLVSTDDAEIADVARALGAEVIQRPGDLARDETPMWPVVRHALAECAADAETVLLVDPTSPGRLPGDVTRAHELLAGDDRADGVVAVSVPPFNPLWTAVVVREGALAPLVEEGARFTRRQDVPMVYRINAVLYLWRASFVRSEASAWQSGRNLPLVVPDERALHIDEETDFHRAEALAAAGFLRLATT